MELQILVSKKGTQVVTASNLHQSLRLPAHKFNRDSRYWLTNIYQFKDGIRFPAELKDFSERKLQHSKQRDYFISVELAKMIALNSSSVVKAKCARQLLNAEQEVEGNTENLSKDQVIAVLELTKVMALMSCQKSVEQTHMKLYERSRGYTAKWWAYRAGLLGYTVEQLRTKMLEVGKNYQGKNFIQMLMHLDKHEIIRMSVIDLFISLGKSPIYAKEMGDLAKVFAKELNIEIWDDRDATTIPFERPQVNAELVQEVKHLKKDHYLKLWA